MEEDKGGWATIIKFSQEREERNRGEARRGKTMRKGIRELNNLGCSINYNKTKNSGVDKVS